MTARRESTVPVTLGDGASSVGPHQVYRDQILFVVPGLARVYIDPEQVRVERAEGASDADIDWLLRGHVATAQRILSGTLSLWAATVVVDGGATAIIGGETIGKSAVAAVLARRGAAVLSDTALPVRLIDGVPVTEPTSDGLSLWPDTLAQLGLPLEAGPRLREGLAKRHVRFPAGGAAPLRTVVAMHTTDDDSAPRVETVPDDTAFQLVAAATLMRQLVEGAGLSTAHRDWVRGIVATTPVLRVRFSRFHAEVGAVGGAVAQAVGL